MKTPTKLISVLMLALAAVGKATAQTKEEDHKAHHPQAGASVAAQIPALAPAPAAAMASKPVGMSGMHDMHQKEMKKIHGTKSPAKRKKLMEKHKKEMHEHMDKNGSMGMMGKGMGASAPGGDGKPGMGMGAQMGGQPMQGAASK